MTARKPSDDYDIEEMTRAARSLGKQVVRATREHPYMALGVAAGVGFVLGGGLRSRTGKFLLATVAKLALPQLETAAMGMLAGFQGLEADETSTDAAS